MAFGAVPANEFSRATYVNGLHVSGLPFILKVFISTYRIITLTLNCLLPKVNTVQPYRTPGLRCTVIRWKRQDVIKYSVIYFTLPLSIQKGLYPEFMLHVLLL